MILQTPQPLHYSGYLMVEKIVLFTGLFATVAFLVWLMARHFRSRTELLRLHLTSRDRLITQAGSLEVLMAFARTEEGRSLLEFPALAVERVPLGLRLIQGGIVCLSVCAVRGLFTFLWVHSLRASGSETLVEVSIREGLAQTLLYGGAGVGLCVAGWFSRRVNARWLLEEGQS